MTETDEHFLSKEEERLLLKIARETLEIYIRENRVASLEDYQLTNPLRDAHGAFVTLHRGGQLRGCIGYIANTMPLAEAVRENVVNAATHDLRFTPVTEEELPEIEIEVSALTPGDTPETPFKKVNSINEIEIGRDGLFIEKPSKQGGLLLPQVAVEHQWNVRQFLSALCQKAGYSDGSWEQPDTSLYRFSAQVFSEGDIKDSDEGEDK